ncbi:Inner membrane protein YpjD [Sinobacterium norvegicum]|uniref:Inner membrane protein YpjD n=1 Tax=Sinobacterium norvegicum TaxID=1641715 RepID=A0ABM9ADL7_9GAMM|nr:cytochrome c biogenesis protein CcsA [Sinobacterium norvegicum]CAH0990791.1 Inner membrane protein YpjD [Sinobacterium norvegicum]
MPLLTISISAVLLYLTCSVYLGGQAWHGVRHPRLEKLAVIAGYTALSGHAVILFNTIFGDWGIDFSVLKVASLTFWLITLITLLSSMRLPVKNLLVPLYIIAAISLVAAQALHTTAQTIPNITFGIGVHILLSILAESIFTIAAVQAITVGIQDRLLKKHRTQGLVNSLPPLQTMETLLFDMLWGGQLILTAALATGIIAAPDLITALTTHKVVFAAIAWLVFAILLWGRHQLGWRGNTAIRWTLTGFVLLMLSYFGSKFVLEFLLS